MKYVPSSRYVMNFTIQFCVDTFSGGNTATSSIHASLRICPCYQAIHKYTVRSLKRILIYLEIDRLQTEKLQIHYKKHTGGFWDVGNLWVENCCLADSPLIIETKAAHRQAALESFPEEQKHRALGFVLPAPVLPWLGFVCPLYSLALTWALIDYREKHGLLKFAAVSLRP